MDSIKLIYLQSLRNHISCAYSRCGQKNVMYSVRNISGERCRKLLLIRPWNLLSCLADDVVYSKYCLFRHGWNLISHSFDHFSIWSISVWSVNASCMHFTSASSLVSLAKRCKIVLTASDRSFTNKKKRSGPKTISYGPPLCIFDLFDISPLTLTNCE